MGIFRKIYNTFLFCVANNLKHLPLNIITRLLSHSCCGSRGQAWHSSIAYKAASLLAAMESEMNSSNTNIL